MMISEGKIAGFTGLNIPSDEVLNNCIHCGLCLPVCPTYSLTGLERSSPRGRIRLIKSVAEGKLSLSKEFVYEMYFCLDCQACETACPAGIKIRISGRDSTSTDLPGKTRRHFSSFYQKILLNWLFARHARLKRAVNVIRVFQSFFFERFISLGERIKLFREDF